MTINFLLSSQLLIMPGISHLFQNFYYSVLTLDTIWNLGQMFLQRKKKKDDAQYAPLSTMATIF